MINTERRVSRLKRFRSSNPSKQRRLHGLKCINAYKTLNGMPNIKSPIQVCISTSKHSHSINNLHEILCVYHICILARSAKCLFDENAIRTNTNAIIRLSLAHLLITRKIFVWATKSHSMSSWVLCHTAFCFA